MQVFSVSQFIAYLNDTFKAIWDPTQVAIEGEVSGFRVSQGQWVNFDLKDEESLVSVFMVLRNLTVPLQDGMRVRLMGFPRVYPKYGKFSFSAESVELVGEGALRKALAMLREKLAQEGLFDPTRKRSLPRFPNRIALIASRESAAYGDFVRILNERWGGLEVDLYHVVVQGEKAPPDIIAAIEAANRADVPYDAIVLTRGGGSFDELMAFNDERLVRSIYASKIPTLVAIGHERDLTLAEEAADVRGSTPTDCARRLVPDRKDVLYEMATQQERITDTLHGWLDAWGNAAEESLDKAERWLQHVGRLFDLAASRTGDRAERWLQGLNERLVGIGRLVHSFNPQSVVQRGFAILKDDAGRVCVSVKGLTAGAKISLQMRDGSAETVVESIKPKLL